MKGAEEGFDHLISKRREDVRNQQRLHPGRADAGYVYPHPMWKVTEYDTVWKEGETFDDYCRRLPFYITGAIGAKNELKDLGVTSIIIFSESGTKKFRIGSGKSYGHLGEAFEERFEKEKDKIREKGCKTTQDEGIKKGVIGGVIWLIIIRIILWLSRYPVGIVSWFIENVLGKDAIIFEDVSIYVLAIIVVLAALFQLVVNPGEVHDWERELFTKEDHSRLKTMVPILVMILYLACTVVRELLSSFIN